MASYKYSTPDVIDTKEEIDNAKTSLIKDYEKVIDIYKGLEELNKKSEANLKDIIDTQKEVIVINELLIKTLKKEASNYKLYFFTAVIVFASFSIVRMYLG